MIPCSQVETIKEIKENVKKIDIIEKSHIRLTIIQQQILKRQDNVDNKLGWLLALLVSTLVAIVLFLGFGIGG